jgi:hypothetical protein
MTRKDVVKPALEPAKKKVSSNNWSFASAHVQGDDDDGTGRFTRDTMLCFKQHGVLALTFHASFDSGIVCSKCFQFMKPGSFALHCEKCDKQDVPTKKDIKKWADSDRKWANLKRCDGDIFTDKKTIWIATRDAHSAYVVHPRFYLGKTSSTLTLKAMCITDGCTKICALNALYKHFKDAHMPGTHTIHPLRIIEAPARNNVEDSDMEGEEDKSTGSGESDILDATKTNAKKDNEDAVEDSASEDDESVVGKGGEQGVRSNTKEVRKASEEEDCKGKDGDEDADEDTGNNGDLLELDCEPYVDEGGPSDDDTETEEAKAKQVSVGKKRNRKKKAEVESHGARKSTRNRRATARY